MISACLKESFHYANIVICLEQQPKFQMQINSKTVLTILLHVENMQNQHVCTAPLFKRSDW